VGPYGPAASFAEGVSYRGGLLVGTHRDDVAEALRRPAVEDMLDEAVGVNLEVAPYGAAAAAGAAARVLELVEERDGEEPPADE
jgi:hypothetical protein